MTGDHIRRRLTKSAEVECRDPFGDMLEPVQDIPLEQVCNTSMTINCHAPAAGALYRAADL